MSNVVKRSNVLAMRKQNLAFVAGCIQSGLNLAGILANARVEVKRLDNERESRSCECREKIAEIKERGRASRGRLKNRREAIRALLKVAINSNDPQMIMAMAEALRCLDEEE